MSEAPPWVAAHAEACAAGADRYRDPSTGYQVFTEVGLGRRAQCCGCGCRHCPFAHEEVPPDQRAERIKRPAMLYGPKPEGPNHVVVFHSGGKDSFLALRAVQRERPGWRPILLTTFDATTRVVAHQELPISRVIEQARALDLPLMGVPLVRGGDYLATLEEALRRLAARAELVALVFGDLHLGHIRAWRETHLAPLGARYGAELRFPIWTRPYARMMEELEREGVEVRISAAPDPGLIAPLRVGDRFDRGAMEGLSAEVDPFGERGEFHTEVVAGSLPELKAQGREGPPR